MGDVSQAAFWTLQSGLSLNDLRLRLLNEACHIESHHIEIYYTIFIKYIEKKCPIQYATIGILI